MTEPQGLRLISHNPTVRVFRQEPGQSVVYFNTVTEVKYHSAASVYIQSWLLTETRVALQRFFFVDVVS